MKASRALASAFLAAALAAPASAQSFGADASGTSAGQFLKLGVGARASALGEAASAVVDDATALHYNAAAMTRVGSEALALMHAPYLGGGFYDYAGYVKRLDASRAVGASVEYFGAGDVARTDEAGRMLGSARPSDLAVTLGGAYRLGNAPGLYWLGGGAFGVSAKYVKSTIVDSASTLAFGASFLSREYGDRRLRVAASIDNLFGKLTFDQRADPLPVTGRLGARIDVTEGLLLGVDAILARDAPPAAAIGSEYDLGVIALRAGVNTSAIGQVGGLAAVSGGVGFKHGGWAFDYALVPFGSLGASHRMSVSVKY